MKTCVFSIYKAKRLFGTMFQCVKKHNYVFGIRVYVFFFKI